MSIQPRNYKLQRAIEHAKSKPAVVSKRPRGSAKVRVAAFNGSVTSRKNKKRPITLPERA